MIKHTNDYNVKTTNNLDELNRQVDDLRLTAMAALEELDQLLAKNKTIAGKYWNVDAMQKEVSTSWNILNKKV